LSRTVKRSSCFGAQVAGVGTDTGQAARYADRAVELLRKAVAKGFKDVAQLKSDPDLDPLRARPSFQKLLTDVSTGGTDDAMVEDRPRGART
jgi:hypothetical protein